MSKQLPYMKWYPADFDEDEDVELMSNEEVGFYVRLLNRSWKQDGLPSDPDRLSRLCGLDREDFDRLWAAVGKKWTLAAESGRLVNGRQERERREAADLSEIRAESARQKHRKYEDSKCSAIAEEKQTDAEIRAGARFGSVSVSVSGSESVSEISTIPKTTGNDFGFHDWCEAVYARHPKKKFKFQVLRALLKRFGSDRQAREQFDKNHKLWCETAKWQEDHGHFVPPLSDAVGNGWIADEAWMHPPSRDPPKKPDKHKAELLAYQAELRRQEEASR